MKRPKIAYLTSNDPRDRRSWSGTHYFMAPALQKHCGDVSLLGPIKPPLKLAAKICDRVLQKTTGRRYLYTHSVWLSKHIAQIVERRLSEEQFDFIFAPAGSTEIAHLDTKLPIVYLSDATFSLISNYYPEFSNVLASSLREAEMIERLAINKAAMVVYPSPWAAQSAMNDYHADERKIHVIPFGANLVQPPARDVVLTRPTSERCRLLFVGVDWARKGGDIAFKTMLALEEMGVPTDLTIVGCTPPKGVTHKNLRVTGFLDKNNPVDSDNISQIFLESSFLVLPTQMECTAIVFCEASAFGLPIITTDTGGVSGAVSDGENGYLMPTSATARNYAETIYELFLDRQLYQHLRTKCRRAFDERLNWDAWAKSVQQKLAFHNLWCAAQPPYGAIPLHSGSR
jgi:glycosyltransferase involved in cell wall biosynthesis